MDLFNLAAKITLDTTEYEKGINEASGKGNTFFDMLKANLTSQAIIGGAKQLGSAIAGIGKAVMAGYADYEQLIGGVETLFKDSADIVNEYAANAYKTAGMSANQYMETVTSFSASLLQGLGGDTEAAARLADRAITDMSDNANKMGTDISMIQNAYQGFAKQNYTLLDNLKLGYGGTQAEMARLINDSGVLGDAFQVTAETVNQVSFDQIIRAIGVVQDRMGITGTTAKEAAETISGSVASMQAAWSNWLVGLADEEQDLAALTDELIESTVIAAGNILPRIGIIAGRVVDDLVKIVMERGPEVLETGKETLNNLANGIIAAIPDMLSRLPDIIVSFVGFLTDNLPTIIDEGANMLENLVFGIIAAIPDMVARLPEIIGAIVEFLQANIPALISAGAELLAGIGVGIIGAIPDLIASIPDVIDAVVEALEAGHELLKDVGKYLLEGLWNGVSDKIGWLKDKFTGLLDKIKGWFTGPEGFDEHSPSKWSKQVFRYVIDGGIQGLDEGTPALLRDVRSVTDQVKAGMDFGTATVDYQSSGIGNMARSMGKAVMNAAGSTGDIVVNVVQEVGGTVVARNQYRFNRAEAERRGGAFVGRTT